MAILRDIWNNEVEITNSFVSYRNRLIDVHLIQTFQVKGKRLLINTFKQNESVPTMCIFFEDKEKAEAAYETMKYVFYGKTIKNSADDSDWPILFAALPAFVLLFAVFWRDIFPTQ